MVRDQFAITPEHRVMRTSPILFRAVRICYGEIAIAIHPVKRLVTAVWITTSGEFVHIPKKDLVFWFTEYALSFLFDSTSTQVSPSSLALIDKA